MCHKTMTVYFVFSSSGSQAAVDGASGNPEPLPQPQEPCLPGIGWSEPSVSQGVVFCRPRKSRAYICQGFPGHSRDFPAVRSGLPGRDSPAVDVVLRGFPDAQYSPVVFATSRHFPIAARGIPGTTQSQGVVAAGRGVRRGNGRSVRRG